MAVKRRFEGRKEEERRERRKQKPLNEDPTSRFFVRGFIIGHIVFDGGTHDDDSGREDYPVILPECTSCNAEHGPRCGRTVSRS
ncbi:unnamed protein product [Rhizoctonia solani]|uniref:Uncharacterized protein n=1 Tax=Rhizoctonia solani TaxID=456999 RepID=A0A8H3HXL6_9AGAM|nr:unnamed protein product [Rhizoctonia solani]